MASVLCSNCNTGIHYHSDPNGIEYVYISDEDWNSICESRFNPESKVIDDKGYPKLFRTDTLESDFESVIHKAWVCPNCKSIITFDAKGNVINTYTSSKEEDLGLMVSSGIAFDDYLWDRITEDAKPDSNLKNQSPTFYVQFFERGIIISRNKQFDDSFYYSII